MASEPTVFVVDDDADLCDALRCLIEADGLPVQTYTSAQAFLEAYDSERPGVLLLDVRMQGMSGLDLQQHLRDRGAAIPIIILTGYADVPAAVRSLKTGAMDFLQKPVNDQLLLDRIREGLRRDAEQRRQRVRVGAVVERLGCLTPREREVLDLVVCGRANKQIALALSVSEKTVEVHRKRMMRKMGIGSAIELVGVVLGVSEAT